MLHFVRFLSTDIFKSLWALLLYLPFMLRLEDGASSELCNLYLCEVYIAKQRLSESWGGLRLPFGLYTNVQASEKGRTS